MTYQEALQYLDSFLNYERTTDFRYPQDLSLGRIEKLLEKLGSPHRSYKTLHVAGTKGKGSTCAFAASILQAAGVKTGLYTSPHLLSFCERIQVNGQPISEEQFCRVLEQVRSHVEEGLTFFEVTTACAFLYFAHAGVEAAVIEVGLGGRWDATNTIVPEVCAITPVSLDHMSKLGSTVAQIAQEKAGIIKPGVPVVMAPQKAEARQVILKIAQAQKASLHQAGDEMLVSYPNLNIPLLGKHQILNASVAIRMVELLAEKWPRLKLTEPVIRLGVARTVWPGRCQLIPGDPPVLLDGAQNADSAQALKEAVEELLPDRPVTLVVGISTDKDVSGMCRCWGPWAKQIILTQAPVARALSVPELEALFRPHAKNLEPALSVQEAMKKAKQMAGPEGLVVVSGSLFVVAEALKLLGLFAPQLGQKQHRPDQA